SDSAAALSDDILVVNTLGELDLQFQSAQIIGPAEVTDLTSLGAIVLSSAETFGPQPSRLGPQAIVARVGYCQVEAAAGLPWVRAVLAAGAEWAAEPGETANLETGQAAVSSP